MDFHSLEHRFHLVTGRFLVRLSNYYLPRRLVLVFWPRTAGPHTMVQRWRLPSCIVNRVSEWFREASGGHVHSRGSGLTISNLRCNVELWDPEINRNDNVVKKNSADTFRTLFSICREFSTFFINLLISFTRPTCPI